MSNFQSFDELIDALQGAVIKAHNLTQNQHILAMKDYFDDDGNPYMVKIQLPQRTKYFCRCGNCLALQNCRSSGIFIGTTGIAEDA